MAAIKIEAFTFEYNELHDRIHVGGNVYNEGAEVNLWLTRRLALRLLNAAVELVEKTSLSMAKTPLDQRSAMALFEHESAQLAGVDQMQSNTKKEVAQASKNRTPDDFLKTDIINRLDISYKSNNYKLSFFVSNDDAAVAFSKIDYNQLHQVLSLVHKGAIKLDWGVQENLFVKPEEVKPTLQ